MNKNTVLNFWPYEYYYVELMPQDPKRKTQTYNIISNSGGRLGKIKWWSPWRTYAFFPSTETVWNYDCLRVINNFLDALKKSRKLKQPLENFLEY